MFDSYDVLGGAHTTNLIWTTEDFYSKNPNLSKAIVAALDEANAWIAKNQAEAVKLYLASYQSDESPELVSKVLKNSITFDTKPKANITAFSDFLYETKAIKQKPNDWKELFFDTIK